MMIFLRHIKLYFLPIFFLAVLFFADPALAKRAAVGRALPPFQATTLHGKAIDLDALKGRVVLIDFWATWCEPCREEFPELDALYQEFQGQALEIIGISVDLKRENIDEFLSKHPVSFPVVHDKGKKISSKFKPRAMPTAFIVDQAGIVRHVHLGYKKSYLQKYREEITALLKNGGGQ